MRRFDCYPVEAILCDPLLRIAKDASCSPERHERDARDIAFIRFGFHNSWLEQDCLTRVCRLVLLNRWQFLQGLHAASYESLGILVHEVHVTPSHPTA